MMKRWAFLISTVATMVVVCMVFVVMMAERGGAVLTPQEELIRSRLLRFCIIRLQAVTDDCVDWADGWQETYGHAADECLLAFEPGDSIVLLCLNKIVEEGDYK